MPNRIRPGQLYLARLSKNELVVRIEEVLPQGGWIARVLSHGRKVKIKDETQIIHACDENGIEWVADATVPNRRSTALPPEPQPSTAILPKEPPIPNTDTKVAKQPIPVGGHVITGTAKREATWCKMKTFRLAYPALLEMFPYTFGIECFTAIDRRLISRLTVAFDETLLA